MQRFTIRHDQGEQSFGPATTTNDIMDRVNEAWDADRRVDEVLVRYQADHPFGHACIDVRHDPGYRGYPLYDVFVDDTPVLDGFRTMRQAVNALIDLAADAVDAQHAA